MCADILDRQFEFFERYNQENKNTLFEIFESDLCRNTPFAVALFAHRFIYHRNGIKNLFVVCFGSVGSYNTYTEDLSKKSSALMESYREIKVELLGE
jgi:hypothetical protein